MTFSLFTVEGTDYTAPTEVATFATGSVTGDMDCIPVTTIQDEDYEGTHSFMAMVSIQTGPAVAAAGTCTVDITEDDGMYIQLNPWSSLLLDLSLADATVSMLVTTDTVAEDVTGAVFSICADPGVTGDIELEFAATLTSNDGKAGI